MSITFKDWVQDEQENRQDSFLDNCYEKAFVIYSYDKNQHIEHLEKSDTPSKHFLNEYNVPMRELGYDAVESHI